MELNLLIQISNSIHESGNNIGRKQQHGLINGVGTTLKIFEAN